MYKVINDGYVRRYDGTVIPLNSDTYERTQYIEWLAEGNTPEPAFTEEELEAETRAVRLAEIDVRLAEIDNLKVRPIGELILVPYSVFAHTRLATLEAEATTLRTERQTLI